MNVDDSESVSSFQDDQKTIILIEDADVILEDFDDGFLPAIQQLVNISKRPVVLTATNQNCQHLYKFMQNSIIFEAANAHNISKWLSVLCLVENHQINLNDIENLYELNGHDLRKTLNAIEFFIKSRHNQQQQQQSHNDNLFNFYYKMHGADKRTQFVEGGCKPFLKCQLNVKSDADFKNLVEMSEMGSITATFGRHCDDANDGLASNLGADIHEYLLANLDIVKSEKAISVENRE